MTSREAIRLLEKAGFVSRRGKGDHVVLTNGTYSIVIPNGKQEVSTGMQGKVRSMLRKVI
jgi:predicted RNA binding protein YcfA (HicA-like mRNA interferase family)